MNALWWQSWLPEIFELCVSLLKVFASHRMQSELPDLKKKMASEFLRNIPTCTCYQKAHMDHKMQQTQAGFDVCSVCPMVLHTL